MMIDHRVLLPGDVLRFTYTNWKGRTAVRTIEYERMEIATLQISDPSSLGRLELYLCGHDLDKQASRSYHVSGIHRGTVEYTSAHSLSKLEPSAEAPRDFDPCAGGRR